MSLIRLALAIFAIALAALGWFAWPIYGFYAHQGEAPFPPWGWMSLEQNGPTSQVVHADTYADAGARVLAKMEAHRQSIGAPGMTAAVAVNGKVVWQGAVGWADISHNVPTSPETIFRIGSTSKAITATALARLVERGDIDLDAPIGTYMKDLPNPEWAAITPRMLASHMAGVPHYGDNQDSGKLKTASLRTHYEEMRDALTIFDDSPLLFDPGSDFEYSSLGTVLLGAVMSEVTGKPYRQIVQDEVLTPAAMTSTIVAPKRPGANSAMASFYYHKNGRYRVWRPIDLSHRLPGGGWASTSTDLVRMGALTLNDEYISAGTRTLFWTPQKLNSGEVNEQDYAIGWRWREYEIEDVGIAKNANHGGVSRGAQSWLLVFPEYDMAIAFNINSKTDEFSDFGVFYKEIFREFALAQKAAPSDID